MIKAVFLDRDGTINVHVPYLSKVKDFSLYPFAGEAIRRFNENNYKVFIITNQSGVGRGFFSERRLNKIHDKMLEDLRASKAEIDKIYFCTNLPEDQSDFRKPNSGMIIQAINEFDIDPHRSYMIGDRESDIVAGGRAGLKTFLVLTGYGQEESNFTDDWENKPDEIVKNINEASIKITDQ